jgi:putative spermidine/putrescine transport system substrate-binding protein
MNALVAAAEKEGHLNVITLPSNWANYGTIMKDFTAKYGIKITDANPEGSSQDELNAIKQLKGQSSAPDVVDVGGSFAATGETDGDWAPYEVATWNDIPADAKASNGDYYADYGGYVAIGYDTTKVKNPPTTFKSLLTGDYKNQVAIDGNPTQTGSAFAAVAAASLANGGSLNNIAPGVSYFKSLKAAGNFVPVEGTTCWRPRSRRSTRTSRSSSRRTAFTPATTTRRSARARPTPRPPGCGRSTCTRPPARTCSCRARPGRSR